MTYIVIVIIIIIIIIIIIDYYHVIIITYFGTPGPGQDFIPPCSFPQLGSIHVHKPFRILYTCFWLDTVNIYWWIRINLCRIRLCFYFVSFRLLISFYLVFLYPFFFWILFIITGRSRFGSIRFGSGLSELPGPDKTLFQGDLLWFPIFCSFILIIELYEIPI